MNRSDQINELAAALAKAQAMMKPAPKDSTNPHFKSRYADLAAVTETIREPLASNGLALIQLPRTVNGDVCVTTMLAHSSGQWISEELTMTPQQKTPQGIGSACTYARRYGAMAITGLSSDDDDGEAASRPQPRRFSQPPPARRGDGPRYETSDSQIPFEGPPAEIGEPDIERYHASPLQKKALAGMAATYGITIKADLQKLSEACAANGGVEMEHLAAAVKEWVDERGKP